MSPISSPCASKFLHQKPGPPSMHCSTHPHHGVDVAVTLSPVLSYLMYQSKDLLYRSCTVPAAYHPSGDMEYMFTEADPATGKTG